jgi:predicted dehydrogenase
VLGAGAWGINHVRTFARAKDVELVMVCDPSEGARKKVAGIAPQAQLGKSLEDAIAAGVDAVVLATPAVSHASLAAQAANAGLHVLVEKPLGLNVAEAEKAVSAARKAGKILMVGHLMLFHPALEKVRDMVTSGELGELFYMYALRVNLGTVRRDENAMWSLAPHDVSMILNLTGERPESVSARGGSYLQQGVEDVVFVNIRFPSKLIAQIQLSWLDPRKERRLTVVGSKKMVELDDAHPTEKVRVYDKGYEKPPQFTEYSEFLQIRQGDILIPRVGMGEPLERECRHFIECIQNGKKPLADGESGLEVVRVLAAAQMSLRADGAPVMLAHG